MKICLQSLQKRALTRNNSSVGTDVIFKIARRGQLSRFDETDNRNCLKRSQNDNEN